MTSEERAALREAASKATPGPWPWKYTGDRKRIVIGDGLVEGPNGYEVAEVYSDDCPREVAEANAALISAMHPAAVLALLDECERMREAVRRALSLLDVVGHEEDDEDGRRLKAAWDADVAKISAALGDGA